jgi:hypothetical protein
MIALGQPSHCRQQSQEWAFSEPRHSNKTAVITIDVTLKPLNIGARKNVKRNRSSIQLSD